MYFQAENMAYNPRQPYNELPLLPPKGEVESRAVLKKTIAAGRALAELNGAIANLPNPTLFIDTIHLQEARASSEVENIITTNDALFRASASDKIVSDPNTKEVLHYKEALWYGIQQLENRPLLTTNLFIRLVQIIKENEAGIRVTPGTQLKNPVTKTVIYTPPEGEQVIRDKLKNLEDFIHGEDNIDPLVKVAIIHYQFEAIHPFSDGNGRTGRILLLLYLKLSGLLDQPTLFLSKYILAHKEDYYTHLRQITEKGNWEPWILYVLDAVEQSANENGKRIRLIDSTMQSMSDRIRNELPRVHSKELMECLFRMPYIKRRHLEDAGLGTYKTVGSYLQSLEKKGFLTSEVVGKERLFINQELMDILST